MVKLVESKSLLEPESFVGLSTDTKPLVDSQNITLRAMCTFWELDTAKGYVFDGISQWYPV